MYGGDGCSQRHFHAATAKVSVRIYVILVDYLRLSYDPTSQVDDQTLACREVVRRLLGRVAPRASRASIASLHGRQQ